MAGGVEGLLGRMGIGWGDGSIPINLRIRNIYSSMLTIAHNVKDRTNYAKSLVTSHNAAILEKVREIPIRIFHI